MANRNRNRTTAGATSPKTPPSTGYSPIKGPTSPSKQPAKNLTNSDPPVKRGNKDAGSAIVGRPKGPNNPDPNKHLTTQTPSRQQKGDVVSRADIQYVPSSESITRFITGDLILPDTIDEAELDNQIGVYDEMLLDPTIAGLRLWTNVNVLTDGLRYEAKQFEPDLGEEEPNKTDVKEADWSRRYVAAAIDRLQYVGNKARGNIMLFLWDLMDGARIPSTIAEATYDTIRTGEYAGNPGIKFLKVKPRRNFNIVLDTMNTFRGIVAIVPGQSLALWSGFIQDVSKLPNAIAEEKLIWFYVDDRCGVPKSLYNPFFGPWLRMLKLYKQFILTAQASAGGKRAVVLGDKAAQQFVNPQTGAPATMEMNASASLQNWNNEGTLVLANGSKPHVFYAQPGALTAFIEGLKMCKREIWTAGTTNDKTAMEGDHGSGLSESKSSDDAQPVIDLIKGKLCIALDGLSFNLLKLAKGEEYAMRYCPKASMERGDIADFPAAGAAWAAIATAEGFTPSQVPAIMKLIGLPPPTVEELDVMMTTWKAKRDPAANPPEPVVAGPKLPVKTAERK